MNLILINYLLYLPEIAKFLIVIERSTDVNRKLGRIVNILKQ